MPRKKSKKPVSPELKALLAKKSEEERQRKAKRRKEIKKTEGFETEGGIKSKDRVQELAEVFTAEREVNAMLDLLEDTAYSMTARFLEPACGNGNFLEEILRRKLSPIPAASQSQEDFEFRIMFALSSTYGIDISEENIRQAKDRLRALVMHSYSTGHNTWKPSPGFYDVVSYVLDTNIILGDSLNGADKIVFIEYSSPKPLKFTRAFFRLSDLEKGDPDSANPFRIIGACYYLDLAKDT